MLIAPLLHPQSHIKKRLFMFRFGDRKTRMNWVHVHNLVQAHVLAAEALTAAKGYVAVSPHDAPTSPWAAAGPIPQGFLAHIQCFSPTQEGGGRGLSAQRSWGRPGRRRHRAGLAPSSE